MKTIELEKMFFKGTRTYTLEEYRSRWKRLSSDLWGFALDYGTMQDQLIAKNLFDNMDNLTERAFNKIYEEQNK